MNRYLPSLSLLSLWLWLLFSRRLWLLHLWFFLLLQSFVNLLHFYLGSELFLFLVNIPEPSSPELFVVQREEVVNVAEPEASLSLDAFEAVLEVFVPFIHCKGQVSVQMRFQLRMWRVLDHLLSFNQLLLKVQFLWIEQSFSIMFCHCRTIESTHQEFEFDVELLHFLFHNALHQHLLD